LASRTDGKQARTKHSAVKTPLIDLDRDVRAGLRAMRIPEPVPVIRYDVTVPPSR